MPDDLPEIFGICRRTGCGYVWTREWEDGLCCPKCGETYTPMYPREAEARVHANRVARARAATPEGTEVAWAKFGLRVVPDDPQEYPSRPIVTMGGKQGGKTQRVSSAAAKSMKAGDVMVYGDQQFGVVRDVSIDGSHVEVISDWKSEEDR